MKFIKAENPLEWFTIKMNWIPMPTIHGILFGTFSKVIYAALQLDIFEAARESPVTINEIAEKTGLNANALRGTVYMLTVLGYFKYKKRQISII